MNSGGITGQHRTEFKSPAQNVGHVWPMASTREAKSGIDDCSAVCQRPATRASEVGTKWSSLQRRCGYAT